MLLSLWPRLRLLLALALVAALGACAHPLALNPNLASLSASNAPKIDKKVGLLISDADKKLEVTTPGGGGDTVRYFPYRDLETGLYVALSAAFKDVSRISSAADPKLQAEQLVLIVTPRLQTMSFSDSVLTWPPTLFTIELVCQITDSRGAPVTELRVMGEGRASFDEFKADPALSANRAAEDVVNRLLKALLASPALR